MSLPNNFAGAPNEELHRYFRNVCIQMKKTIKNSKDVEELQQEMDRFIDASKQMNWHTKTSGVYHKDDGEKATKKVLSEYIRYVDGLLKNAGTPNAQDLLDALSEVERLIDNLKAT